MIKQFVLVAGTAGVLALTACSSAKKGASTTAPPPAPTTSSASSSASPPSTTASTPTAAAVAISTAKTGKGTALVGPNGHVLYTYDPDTATTSSCTGGCASTWPPLVGAPKLGAGLDAADFGTIKRADGTMQVTYDHHPLYYYTKDEDGGDLYGDGIGGVWHLAKSDDAAPSAMSSSSESGGGGGNGY